MICVGIVATFLLSYYVQKTEKYKRVFMLCSVLSVASLFLLVGGIYYLEMFWVVIIASILLGFAQIPLIPLSFDFGCEIVFPVGEAQVTGVLMSGGQIIGVLEVSLI
jgi:FLVCR family feline leukemia virus subgroup C receptor-related protein